jgi:hypothetical protein
MTLRAMAVAIVATACLACTGETPPNGQDEGALGTLALNLTGSDRHGTQYRLREAEFDVVPYSYYPSTGQGVITLSSETNPLASSITTRLAPGTYTVTLSNRLWYLERLSSNGPERVEDAVLLSEASVYTYVYDRGTSDVYFTFGVDGELIDFRAGKLRINIAIELPDEDGGVAPPDNDAAVL